MLRVCELLYEEADGLGLSLGLGAWGHLGAIALWGGTVAAGR